MSNSIVNFQQSSSQTEPIVSRMSSLSFKCRVCLDSCEMGDLISPCFCKGSIGLIHKHCLEKWLTAARIGKCEICGYEFFTSTNAASFSRWLSETLIPFSNPYLNSIQRIPIFSKIACLFVLLTILGICIWFLILTSNNIILETRQNISTIEESTASEIHSIVSVLTFLIALLVVISTVWATLAVRHNYRSWKRYQMRHSHIEISQPETTRLSAATPDNQIRYQSFGMRTPVSPSHRDSLDFTRNKPQSIV